jgi:hypothetical protein
MSTTIFIECVSCGAELILADREMADKDAAQIAHDGGWSVCGHRGAKRTRCRRCRKDRRRDTNAADEGWIGNRAGYQTTGRSRV